MINKKARDKATVLIHSAVEAGKSSLLEYEGELVAKLYGIEVAASGLAKSEKQGESLAKRLGFPLVMKIVSKDILHKSDAGGVRTNISSSKDARRCYREIIRNVKKTNRKAVIDGVLIQKMAPKGPEFVVGATRDPQFGPTVMFGLGGIYVELFKDVAFRLAPISEEEALSMMKETKSYQLLTGFRGSKPLDIRATGKTIMAVGDLMLDQSEVDSVDINPLFIYPKGAIAVDVRIILRKPEQKARAIEEKLG
jgi:acetate---CoA ligase (ADP-forming) subunit beta